MSTEIKPGDCHCRECAAHYPTPAPLDPKSVHVGDTVTVRFTETGDVVTTKAYQPDDITAAGEYVYILGWPLHRANGTFGLAVSHFEILAVEPAPEPEPEWNRAADYVATVRGIPGVRVTWSPVDDGDSNPWRTREPITDEKHSWHPESEVTDVRPLVVIDPAAVDWPALQGKISQRIPGERPFAVALGIIGIVAEALGIEATS